MGILLCILALNILIAAFIAWRLGRSVLAYLPPKNLPASADLPTVSVCIPARNERHAMTQCLERVLASSYKKLEVIVFDDSSDDETSVLIRSFAHAGVRFVPGTELPEGWLGRNHALGILAQEASGEILVFMDVDTFVEPESIGNLVRYMRLSGKKMLSVIPGRSDIWRTSVPFGSLRYFWQLVLATKNKPAASSALWAITSAAITEVGGFAPYRSAVQLEPLLASRLAADYQCFVNAGRLGVTYQKKWRSQLETSRRLLYPSVSGWRFLPTLFILILMNAPNGIFLSGLLFGWSLINIVALGIVIIQALLYVMYAKTVWRHIWWLGVVVWPISIFQETALLIWSAISYARHTVTWKGRPVTASSVRVDSLTIDK